MKHKTMNTTKFSFLILSLPLFLSGCLSDDQDDLKAWIKVQEQTVRGRVEPLPSNLDYAAIPFEGAPNIDPFKSKQLKIMLAPEVSKNQKTSPELNRRKEPLESYPLSDVSVTGLVTRDGKVFALVKTARDNLTHTVGVGNYIGNNYGKILKVENDKIIIREIILLNDEWVEKNTEIPLSEGGVAINKNIGAPKTK